jgi:hypothetical protein
LRSFPGLSLLHVNADALLKKFRIFLKIGCITETIVGLRPEQVPMAVRVGRALFLRAALVSLIAYQSRAYEASMNPEANGQGSSELGLAVQGALGNKVLIPTTATTSTPENLATGNRVLSQPDTLDAPPGVQSAEQQPVGQTGPAGDTTTSSSQEPYVDPDERAKRVNMEIFRKDSDVKSDPLQRGTRWWTKRPLIRMSKDQVREMDEKYPYITADESAYGSLVPASIASADEFKNMNDTELYTYFKYGTADVPSNQPGEAGMHARCFTFHPT